LPQQTKAVSTTNLTNRKAIARGPAAGHLETGTVSRWQLPRWRAGLEKFAEKLVALPVDVLRKKRTRLA
jgi:hypothetical protein